MKFLSLLLLASPLAFAKTYQYHCTNLMGEVRSVEVETALLSKRVTKIAGFKLKVLSGPEAPELHFNLSYFMDGNQADLVERAKSVQHLVLKEDKNHDDHGFDVAFLGLKNKAYYLYANHRSPWCQLFEGSCASEYYAFECTRN